MGTCGCYKGFDESNNTLNINSNEKEPINNINKDKFIQEKKIKITNKLIQRENNKNDEQTIIIIFKFEEIEYTVACKNSDIFSRVEEKLYTECFFKPKNMFELSNNSKLIDAWNNLGKMFPFINIDPNMLIGNHHFCFFVNGIKIDKSKTIKENNIRDHDIVLISYLDINLINVYFKSDNPEINYKLSCYDIYLFYTIEQKLYIDNPILQEKNIIFQVEGKNIYKTFSLEQNNIKNDSIITMIISDKKKIKVTFISIDQKTKLNIYCYNTDIFFYIEEEVYKKAKNLKNKYYFIFDGNLIDKYLTVAQNKIKNEDIILIVEEDDELEDLIAIIFIYQGMSFAISCSHNDLFSVALEKLYQNCPLLKEKNFICLHHGEKKRKSATIKENGIKMGEIILIIECEY